MKPSARPASGALAALSALLLGLALLLAQVQGQVHRVLHGPGTVHAHGGGHDVDHDHDRGPGGDVDPVPSHAHGDDPDHDDGPGALVAGWLALFAGHDSASDCRLFDQGGHSALPQALPMSLLPPFLPPGWVAVHATFAPAWRCALIQARGPPAFR